MPEMGGPTPSEKSRRFEEDTTMLFQDMEFEAFKIAWGETLG